MVKKSRLSSKVGYETKQFQYMYENVLASLINDIKNLFVQEQKSTSTIRAIYDSLMILANMICMEKGALKNIHTDWRAMGDLKKPTNYVKAMDFVFSYYRTIIDEINDKGMIFKKSIVSEIEDWEFWDMGVKNADKDKTKDTSKK